MVEKQVLKRRLEGRSVRSSVVEHHGLIRLFEASDEEVVATFRSAIQDGHGGDTTLESWRVWLSSVWAAHVRVLADLWR